MAINTGEFGATTTGSPTNEMQMTQPEVLTDNVAYKQRLRALPEVQNLTNEIDITNVNSILAFGQKPSEGISQTSDMLLSSMQRVNTEEASRMLTQLTKIMDKFDIKELENPENASMLQKLFGKIKNSIDKLFAKYEDMGKEVDKIYVILKQYESQIHQTQEDLEKQYRTNVTYYEELEKYIVAGELAQEEIEAYQAQMMQRTDLTEQEKQTQQQKL